jgi:CO/xanthine dehydrogenase Mo-binding subunit
MLGGAAVMQAAEHLKKTLLEAAAEELEVSPGDLVMGDGAISVIGAPTRSISFSKLVTSSGGVIKVEDRFVCELLGYPYGLHVAAVEVDAASGAVRIDRYHVAYDIGRVINPVLVRGQIAGGFAQGVGGALLKSLLSTPTASHSPRASWTTFCLRRRRCRTSRC